MTAKEYYISYNLIDMLVIDKAFVIRIDLKQFSFSIAVEGDFKIIFLEGFYFKLFSYCQ